MVTWIFALVILFGGGQCWAQELSFDHQRLSWAWWWETKSDVYLQKHLLAKGGVLQQGQLAEKREEYRLNAIEALLETSRSKDLNLRAESALALGRMRADKASPRLAELARDPEQRVRRAAVVALGLMDSSTSRQLLSEAGKAEAMDTMAWIAAVMMLDEPSDEMVKVLARLLRDPRSEHVQGMAAWALRMIKPEGYMKLLVPMLQDTPSILIASEIVLAMGENHDPGDLELLSRIVDARYAGNKLEVMRLADGGQIRNNLWPSILAMKPTLRAAAAMALEQYADLDPTDPRLKDARRRLRKTLERGYGRTDHRDGHYRGISMMAMGEIGEDEDLDYVISFITEGTVHHYYGFDVDKEVLRNDSTRGFAVISLGKQLAARSASDLQEDDQKARDYERFVRRGTRKLGVHLQSSYDPPELRAACALALGLSGKKEAAPWLIATVRELGKGDELIMGHCILALAMLGEPVAKEAAAAFFGKGGSPDTKLLLENDVLVEFTLHNALATRAAAMGVLLMGDVKDVPMLTHHWGREPWVSLEAAKVAGWLGDYELSPTLLLMLKQDKKIGLSRLAARSLGEMFDSNHPSRLSRLVVNTNYTHQMISHPLKDTKGRLLHHLEKRHLDADIPGLANPLFYLYMMQDKYDKEWPK